MAETTQASGDGAALRMSILANQEARILHFARRIVERGHAPGTVVIVVIDADDVYGHELVEALMPGRDWSAVRARGERPIARGLAELEGIASAVAQHPAIDAQQAVKNLCTIPAGQAPVCVVAGGGVLTAYVDLPTPESVC